MVVVVVVVVVDDDGKERELCPRYGKYPMICGSELNGSVSLQGIHKKRTEHPSQPSSRRQSPMQSGYADGALPMLSVTRFWDSPQSDAKGSC